MKQTLKHIGIFFFMLLFSCALYAQRFFNVSIDGAQTVSSISQDADGMMWLGTENGLYSYDGYHSYKQYVDHSFSNTRVNALAVDGDLLYLATGNGMLCFHVKSNSYERTLAVDEYQNENKRKGVKELRAIDLKHGCLEYGSEVYALLDTPRGLLMGTLSGLFLVKSEEFKEKNEGRRVRNSTVVANGNSLVKLPKLRIPLPGIKQPLVNALAYDAKRRCYWIGTEGALYCADLQLKTFSKIAALDGNSVKCLAEEGNGNLYVGTDNGLYRISLNNSIDHFEHDSREVSSIPNNIVWSCFVDKWQNVWIGTDNGLSCLSTHTYYQYIALDKVTMSGEGNCLHDIYQTREGDWWMGGTNGLIHFSEKGSSSPGTTYTDVTWYKQNNLVYPLNHNRVRKIYEDPDGDVWICTDHGVNLYNHQTRQLENFIVYDKTGRYSTAWAYDVLQDKQGRMWFASYNGGVFVIAKSRLLTEIAKKKASANSSTSSLVSSQTFFAGLHIGQLVMDGQGMIWASAFNKLDRIDPRTMAVTHIPGDDVINYLMADDRGNVWIGSNAKVKCFLVDSSSKPSSRTSASDVETKEWGIGSKVVTMCSVAGKVWVVSGKECSIIDQAGESYRFRVPFILPLTMFYSCSRQEVVMGGNDGYVCIRIDGVMRQATSKEKTNLLLSNIVVNGLSMTPRVGVADESDTDVLAPRNLKKLTLESDENNFTLQLTDLPFGDHPSAVYTYQLEGSDHEWRYLSGENLDIAYNGLPYGDYRLTVHAVDGEGKVGDEVYSLDISILPPWYLSIWAKMVYLLLVVALAYGAMRFYLVRERLAEERRQKAEILEQASARMNFFSRLAEELKTAVVHRSFAEITDLVNRSLEMNVLPETALPEDKQEQELAMQESPQEDKTENPVLSESDQRLLKEVNEAIEQHMIDSDFNVTTLQETIGIGGKQLYRKLKSMTGMTPVEYIRDMRMKKAALMLNKGKFSVSEVMYTVGFSNSSYFSKCFSKAFGMTPTEYMKK